MAEFKDISLFETITPTYNDMANLYVQVSATEKVSLQQVAKAAGSATMTGFTTPTGTGAVYATDTIVSAIRKIAGRTLNAPCRIAWNNSQQIAIAFAKLGIAFSTNHNNPVIQVNSRPSYNLASDSDGTIINGILGSGPMNQFPIGYKLRSVATGATQNINPGEILTCGSHISTLNVVHPYFCAGNSSAIVYLLAQGAVAPNITFPTPQGGKIIKSADWSNIFDETGIYVLCFQYLYTASDEKHIAVNVAKYQ